jgi:hypothetical protein
MMAGSSFIFCHSIILKKTINEKLMMGENNRINPFNSISAAFFRTRQDLQTKMPLSFLRLLL